VGALGHILFRIKRELLDRAGRQGGLGALVIFARAHTLCCDTEILNAQTVFQVTRVAHLTHQQGTYDTKNWQVVYLMLLNQTQPTAVQHIAR
jgi:hypothetical protein